MTQASIPKEVIRNLFSTQKFLNSPEKHQLSSLFGLKALQHTVYEQMIYKNMHFRYSMAQQQMQSASLAHMSKQTQALHRDLLSSKKHASSLEQVIQSLRGKTPEPSKQIPEEYQENLATLRAQLQETQAEIETIARDARLKDEAKQEIAAELEAIQTQFKDLKKQVFESKTQIESSEKARIQAETLSTTLNQKLLERTEAIEALDVEVKSLKEMLHEGIRQAKTIEKEYLEAIDEKVSATNSNTQLHQSINQSQEEIRLLKEQLNDAHEREQLMQSETGHQLDQLVRQRDQYRSQHKETSETLELLRRHFGELEQSHKLTQEQLKRAEMSNREHEHEIKTAHQHLAKKVKETTLLSEQLEDLKVRLVDAQKTHEHSQTRINEMKAKFEQHANEEKRLQEKIHEAQKHGEEQIHKWEEKYFRLAEKLQSMETRNKELQTLEERHNQMQALLAGLGNFVGNTSFYSPQPTPPPQPQAPAFVPLRAKKPDPLPEEPESLDLFSDLPQQSRTFKKDLFGEQ